MGGLMDTIGQVFRAIWAHKLRSFLTMFGIAWGVASLLLLVGLGEGFRSGQRRSLSQLGENVILMFGGTIPAMPNQHNGAKPYRLTLDDLAAVRTEAPHVLNAAGILNRGDLKQVSEYANAGGAVLGTEPNFPHIRFVPMAQGRFLSDEDIREKRLVCVLGWKSNKLLFPGRPSLAAFITLNGFRFQVIGVAERIGHGNRDGDNQKVYIPLTTMIESFPMKGANVPENAISSIQYQPTSPDLNETAKAEVHTIVARNHGFDVNNKEAFEEWDTIKNSRMVGKIFDAMDGFLGAVGLVTLALGAVGIVNIMLVTVSERTKEIGLLKALGATKRSIMAQFFLEGLVLTGISGAVGIIGAGSFMLALTAALGNNQMGFDPPRLVPWTAAMAMGTLTVCGLGASIYPAYKAANLEPVEALRKE